MSIACPSTSPGPTTKRAASTRPASGPRARSGDLGGAAGLMAEVENEVEGPSTQRYELASRLFPYARCRSWTRPAGPAQGGRSSGRGRSGWGWRSTRRCRALRTVVLDDNEGVARLARDLLRPSARSRSSTGWARASAWSTRASPGTSARSSGVEQEIYEFDLLPEEGHKCPAFVNLQQHYVEEFLVERIEEALPPGLRSSSAEGTGSMDSSTRATTSCWRRDAGRCLPALERGMADGLRRRASAVREMLGPRLRGPGASRIAS